MSVFPAECSPSTSDSAVHSPHDIMADLTIKSSRFLDHSGIIDSDLSARIIALPQELQNSILSFLLQLPTSVQINRNYQPPLALHLDRTSRRKPCGEYYTNTMLECTTPNQHELCDDTIEKLLPLHRWLHSLSDSNRSQFRELHIIETKPRPHTVKLVSTGYQLKLHSTGSR